MFKIFFTVVFLNESEDESFCGSLAIGMKFVNFSVIDEDSQSEVESITLIKTPKLEMIRADAFTKMIANALLEYQKNEKVRRKEYQLHVVWAGYAEAGRRSEIELAIRSFNLFRASLTIVSREPTYLASNEFCKNIHREPQSLLPPSDCFEIIIKWQQ